ncbi:hypothetical protein Hanom_Chr02g00169881 [Helianthus anomalus]
MARLMLLNGSYVCVCVYICIFFLRNMCYIFLYLFFILPIFVKKNNELDPFGSKYLRA